MATHPEIPIVDDDPMMAKTLSDVLKAHDYHTATADSATEAFDTASATAFGCRFSVVRMPERTGVELHQVMREQLGDVPTVASTARPETQLVQQGIDAGVAAIFTKPLDLDILFGFHQVPPGQMRNFTARIGQSSPGKTFTERNPGTRRVITGESLTPKRHRCESL